MKTETIQGAVRRIVDEHKAAAYVGFSVHTLRKDRREAMRLPFFRIGTAIRYDLDRIDAALEPLEVGGSSPHQAPPLRKRRAAEVPA